MATTNTSSRVDNLERNQQRTQNKLDQTEQWLRMFIDSAEDYAIFSINPEGRIATWSRGAEKIFGYRPDEIVGQEFAVIFTEEDRAQGAPTIEIEQAQREGYYPDVRWHVRKDGSRLFAHGHVRPLRDKDGHTLGFLKVAHDITEQKKNEQQLHDSEERYRLLIGSIKDFALFTFDLEGRVTHWNPGAERLFGYSESEILGQDVVCLYTTENQKAGTPEHDREVALRKGSFMDEQWLVRKDGTRFFSSEALQRIDDDSKNVVGFSKVVQDITQRKQLEDELRQAREHLEALVAERTARLQQTIGELESFSYSVSHDLRAPLRAMQGFSELLRLQFGEQLGADGSDLINKIIDASRRLDELINDVLTLSRVAREPMRLEPVDLEKIIREIIGENPDLQQPKADVSVASPLLPVSGHKALLHQCFSNLLANAAKFVGPGVHPKINIQTERVDGRVRIWVIDNGIGIPKEQQERIFLLFQRLHRVETYRGTGIGLAIVRKAVERMNGKVGVDSEPGKGSRFWVELGDVSAWSPRFP